MGAKTGLNQIAMTSLKFENLRSDRPQLSSKNLQTWLRMIGAVSLHDLKVCPFAWYIGPTSLVDYIETDASLDFVKTVAFRWLESAIIPLTPNLLGLSLMQT
jgi:hypothetical protein